MHRGDREKRAPRERELSERERLRVRVRVMRKVSERGGIRDFGVSRVWGKKIRFMKFFVQKFQKPRHRDGTLFFALWRGL